MYSIRKKWHCNEIKDLDCDTLFQIAMKKRDLPIQDRRWFSTASTEATQIQALHTVPSILQAIQQAFHAQQKLPPATKANLGQVGVKKIWAMALPDWFFGPLGLQLPAFHFRFEPRA